MTNIKHRKPKKKQPVRVIIVIVILTVAAILWAGYTDVIILRKTEDMVGSGNAISILFVGSSQVFVGNVPRQLQTIAKMYGVEIIYKDISRHGNRGGTLERVDIKVRHRQ